MNNPELPETVFAGVAKDPDVQQLAKEIVVKALHEMSYLLENGTPRMQMELMRSVVPQLSKGLNQNATSDEMVQMRKDMKDLFAEVRKGGKADAPEDVTIEEDLPPDSNVVSIKK